MEQEIYFNMSAPLEVCTQEEQRAVIRFLWAEGVDPSDIFRRMYAMYGNSVLKASVVHEWVRAFKKGRTSLMDVKGFLVLNDEEIKKAIRQLIQSKYDPALAAQILEWMKDVMGSEVELDTSGDRETFGRQLKDGQILCRLINVLQPGSIPEKKINNSKMAFKCMENINLFLEQVKKLGVPAEETFQTVDLWEEQNLTSVLICLQSVARKASKFGFKSIGPKEAAANVRQFSEEQLKAGQNIISLQYGSNKGANQSGINFGNTRHM